MRIFLHALIILYSILSLLILDFPAMQATTGVESLLWLLAMPLHIVVAGAAIYRLTAKKGVTGPAAEDEDALSHDEINIPDPYFYAFFDVIVAVGLVYHAVAAISTTGALSVGYGIAFIVEFMIVGLTTLFMIHAIRVELRKAAKARNTTAQASGLRQVPKPDRPAA